MRMGTGRCVPHQRVPSEEWAEDRLREYRRTGDRRVRNEVVEEHRWLAFTIARDMRRGAEPFDDLVQVALMGLIKAADRFDPDYGVAFTSYAAVTARGELRRYYRDAGWAIRVPRRLQELRYEVRAATDVLAERLHRSPTTVEVAEYLHVNVDDVIDALCADDNYRARSLDDRAGDGLTIGDRIGGDDARYDECDAGDAFEELTALLPPRMRRIVELRYIANMKQSDIAAEVGISQVHVSRLLHQAHLRLRVLLDARARQPGRVASSAHEGSDDNRARKASSPPSTDSSEPGAITSAHVRAKRTPSAAAPAPAGSAAVIASATSP